MFPVVPNIPSAINVSNGSGIYAIAGVPLMFSLTLVLLLTLLLLLFLLMLKPGVPVVARVSAAGATVPVQFQS
jgi:uncharacterized membrane protein